MLYRYKWRARAQAELEIGEPLPLLDVLPELREAAAADHPRTADLLRQQAEVAEWQTQRIQNPPSERA